MSRVPLRLRFACLTALSVVLGGLAVLTLSYLLLQDRLGPSIEQVPLSAVADTDQLGSVEPNKLAEDGQQAQEVPGPGAGPTPAPDALTLPDPSDGAAQASPDVVALQDEIEEAALRAVLVQSTLALAVTAVAALAVAWLVAGRYLTPIRSLTNTARELSESTLDRRIGHTGPRDEVHELADSFDRMLDRLEAAFEAQRRFVANASHELRTPVTVARTAMEVLAAKPDPSVAQVRAAAATVVAAAERSERSISGLLALARAHQGLDRRDTVRLDVLAAEAARARASDVSARGLTLRLQLEPAEVRGDPSLLETLVGNLVDNAVKYNVHDGWIQVAVGHDGRSAVLRVENSGAVLPTGAEEWIFEPFRRGQGDRRSGSSGAGLGLAIVRSIASAHEGEAHAMLPAEGGLSVTVVLPASSV